MHSRKTPNPPSNGIPAFLTGQPDGVLLAIKLQPRASKNEIGETLGDELRIKVIAPPVDAAANEALLRLLAETLDCPRGKVELLRGHTSRHKTVKIYGMTAAQIISQLQS
jgi:uncharacterized protein (TIGR00251 family)